MNSPYKYRLEKLQDQEVIIHRANTSDLKGKVAEVEEDGCLIQQDGPTSDSVIDTFVAYEDIRGVGCADWDYGNL